MDWTKLDAFMKRQGFEYAAEEGGDDSPYRRSYYNSKTGQAWDVVQNEAAEDLACLAEDAA